MSDAAVRRIRELNENNTKKFIEERKRQAVIQSRQIELLRRLHQEQTDKVRLEMNSVCQLLIFSYVILGDKYVAFFTA